MRTRRDLLRVLGLGAAAVALEACAPAARRRGAAVPSGELGAPTGSARRLAYGSAPQQFGDLRLPAAAGPHPVVIVVHGGFWMTGHDLGLMSPLCEALRGQGLATWNVEYRRLGDPGGGWPGTFLDVAGAVDHLRLLAPEHQLDLARVVTLGHSAGGQLALWAAGRRWIREGELQATSPFRIRGAVALAGMSDLEQAWRLGYDVVTQLMGGSPDDVPGRYAAGSPAALLPLGVPQALVHGTADAVVPPEMSERYRALARQRGDDVALVSPDVGHAELIDPASSAWPDVLSALDHVRRAADLATS